MKRPEETKFDITLGILRQLGMTDEGVSFADIPTRPDLRQALQNRLNREGIGDITVEGVQAALESMGLKPDMREDYVVYTRTPGL